MTDDIKEIFNKTVADVTNANVDFTPSQQDKLNLYGLYKQATVGNVTGEVPGVTDFKSRLKYLAWKKYYGLSTAAAMQQYIEYIENK